MKIYIRKNLLNNKFDIIECDENVKISEEKDYGIIGVDYVIEINNVF